MSRIKSDNQHGECIDLGLKYERQACLDLKSYGYDTTLLEDWGDNFDVMAWNNSGVSPIEVKASKPKKHNNGKGTVKNRWQWDVKKVYYSHLWEIDFPVILYAEIAENDYRVFVLTSEIIRKRQIANISISTTKDIDSYSGWLAEYEQDFTQIENCIA